MTKKSYIKFLGVLLVVGLLFAAAPVGQTQAATTMVACTGTGDTALLQAAIDTAAVGDTISVTGTCVLDSNITVSKAVTLDGNSKAAKIQVSGTGYRITMTTAGATLKGFEIEKTDKTGGQDIIWINASNITIENNKVHGQFVIGDGEIARAIVISGGNSGLLITGNEFYGLRQPAYISGVTTGTISNNYTHGTRGWVVEGGNLTFTGNTWGTVALGNANVYDIAILTQVGPTYYTDVPAMSAANNNAFIEDQRGSVNMLTPVYVNASAPACASDCGTARAPYNKIQDGIARVIPGGTVNVAAGTYSESQGGWRDLTISKSLSLIGAGSAQTIVKFTNLQHGLEIIPDAAGTVLLQGITFTKQDANANSAGWAVIVGETGGTFQKITFSDVDISYASARNLHFNANTTYQEIVIENSKVHHSDIWGACIAGPTNKLTVTNSDFTNNGKNDPMHGYGLDLISSSIQNATITGGHFDDNFGPGININSLTNATFDGVSASHNGNFNSSPADYEVGVNLWDFTGSGSNNVVFKNGTFANNERGGIAMGNEGALTTGPVTVESSTITGNGLHGVLTWFTSSAATPYQGISIHHNRIINSGTTLIGNIVNGLSLENNWWGCNEGFGQPGCSGGMWCATPSCFTTPTWLVMKADDDFIPVNKIVRADLTDNNLGVDTGATHLPAATVVSFTPTTLVEPDSTTLVNGVATTGFTNTTPGTYNICRTLDNEVVCNTYSLAGLLMDPPAFTTTDTCTGTHEVYVKVQAVTNLVAYDLDLTYDSSLITVTKVENVGIVGGAAAPGNSFADGVINFGWYFDTGAGNPPTYNGQLNLIKITFQSKGLAGSGGFTIQPTSILVDWPDVFAIPYEITGGATVNFGSIVTNITADPDKAYCDLALAVAEANANDTLRADADITTIDSITIDEVLTLNTNSKTITRTGTGMVGNNFFVVNPGGNLTINGGGTITTTLNTAIRIIGNGITPAKVKLENATVYGPYFSVAVTGNEKYVGHDTPYPAIFEMTGGATNETVFVSGNGAELIVSGGTLTGAAPIMGNGTVSETTDVNKGGTKITIGGETTVVNGNTNLAIYHPQDGLLTINGGTITGTNGIEMKAGDLIVTGGTILGTGPFANPTATGNGSTDTGDAILIYNRNGYTGDLNVTISGSPTITSTNAYALREFTLPGETSRLGVAAISGGHFTGGIPGAVSFTTVSDTNLDLTGGDYSTDPIAYVYAPYGTYLNTDNRWYIAPLPVISSTDFDDQVNLGVQSTFNLTVDPSVPGAFNMVFTGYPSETEIVYLGVTYTCVMSGDPAICTITVPVLLTGLSQSLPFAITVATATSETPAASYPVTATLHALAPAYGVTGRDLASLSVTVPVASGFAVTGTFSMQGNLSRAGIPVTLTWGGTLATYGPSADTTSAISNNFSLSVLYGGEYTITTLQPRYLNVTADLLKKITVAGPYNMSALILKGGNAYWKATADTYDNIINGSDASLVGNQYGSAGSLTPIGNHGDCNFDGIVNIQDLALVGGNYDLTSELAYNTSPNIWVP